MNQQLLGILIAAAGLILLILELASPGIYLGVLGTALFIGGIAGLIWQAFFWKAFAAAAVVALFGSSILFYLFYRKTSTFNNIQVGSAALAGKSAIVTEKIDPIKGSGKIRIENETWTARADEEIEAGSEVVVESLRGVTAMVKKQ